MRLNFTHVLIPLLLLTGINRSVGQTLDLSKSVTNITTGGNGVSAAQNDVLEYTIIARNLTTSNVTGSRLYDNIPAGSAYVAGTTTLNGAAVADISGNMRYVNTGSLINSPAAAAGVLAPGIVTTIKFRVRVTANGGNVTNYAIAEGTTPTGNIVQSTNSVVTNVTPDPTCSVVYQSTSVAQNGTPQDAFQRRYRYIKTVSTTNGTAGPIIYDGNTGLCRDAITNAVLTAGSIMAYTSAIAFDKNSNRIYFVNNTTGTRDLCYVDLSSSPATAYRYVGYPLETNTSSGWNINRMAFASDGFGYAITESGSDIIRFSINSSGIPVINRMGALINDVTNGSNDILSEVGGDIFGDGSGNLYLVANSSKLYKINPNTKVSTFLGSITPFPGTSNSIAVDAAGNVYVGGAYQNVYTVNLATMIATSITGGSTSNVWTNGDYTSCGFPVLAPALIANKTYSNINGSPFVVGGDTIEYRIEVTNTGNINAAGVKLYDGIPTATSYIPGSTKLNGVTVADVSGAMPFSVTGGRFINTVGEQNGIIKVGAANKAVVTFRAKTSPGNLICNQSRITLLDASGNTIFIISNDPSQAGNNDPTCFYADGVLASENLTLKAFLNNHKSQLQWNVKSEFNITRYEVEYSEDGKTFRNIGFVSSKGNTTLVNNYQFTDDINTSADTRFYRLKIINTKDNHSYSPVIKLSSKSLQSINAQPNPFETEITVQLQLKNAEMVEINLLDFYGRKVLSKRTQLSKGSHILYLNPSESLASGLYILEVLSGNDSRYQQKMIRR